MLPSGSRSATASPSGPAASAATTTPRHSTKTANAGWAGVHRARGEQTACRAAQATSTTAAAPGHPERLDAERRADQRSRRSISADHDQRRPGHAAGRRGPVGPDRRARAGRARKSSRSATYSTTRTTASTGAIRAAKPAKVRSRCGIASRLVRLETGQQQGGGVGHPRCTAGRRGRVGARTASAAPTTTGVSSTTVASRLSTVVTAAASRKTPVIRPPGRPPAEPGHHPVRRCGEHARRGRRRRRRPGSSPGRARPGRGGGRRPRRSAQVERPGGQRGAAAARRDRGLDAAAGVPDRRGEQHGQAGHRHRLAREVGEGRHGRKATRTCGTMAP